MGCGALQSEQSRFIDQNLPDEDRAAIAEVFMGDIQAKARTRERSELLGDMTMPHSRLLSTQASGTP